jgi:DNA-binding CsgD family transcriptional regulator
MSETFLDAATRLCAATLELGVHGAVMLHYERGPVGLVIDNAPFVTDEMRAWTVTDEAWHLNPVTSALRRKLAVLGPEVIDCEAFFGLAYERGYAGPVRAPFAAPLISPAGWFGTVVCTSDAAPSVEVEHRLALCATQLSVWCTNHGIATLPDLRPLAHRQHQVATLAAKGHTNPEIADLLGISVNTVKLRLKQAYERLRVDSRTGLGAILRRLAPLDGVPPGISRRDGYTITRRP